MHYLRLLLLTLLALFSGLANASFPATDLSGTGTYKYNHCVRSGTGCSYEMKLGFGAACSSYIGSTTGGGGAITSASAGGESGSVATCAFKSPGYEPWGFDYQISRALATGYSCPSDSTLSGTSCTCSTGYDQVDSSCVAHVDVCAPKLGTVVTVNFTEGYTRTSDEGDRSAVGPVNTPPADGLACSAGCKVSLQTSGPGVQPYVSSEPTAQGLYRRSLDLPARHLGAECTGSGVGGSSTHDAPVNPALTAPTCPGFVGEVNGRLGCYGSAQAPVTTTSMPRNDAAPSVPGNPAAGTKPPSGEGSGSTGAGRTPSSGNGGNAGGPAASAVNKAGDGTVLKPVDSTKEQQNCGAPGQPKCGINEEGTPKALTDAAYTASLDTYKSKAGELADKAAGTGDKTFFGGWTGAFSAPPIASCSPFDLPRGMGSIDPCPVVEGVRSVMAYIWAIAALWLSLGMIRRVI